MSVGGCVSIVVRFRCDVLVLLLLVVVVVGVVAYVDVRIDKET